MPLDVAHEVHERVLREQLVRLLRGGVALLGLGADGEQPHARVLAAEDGAGVDADDDLGVIPQFGEQLDLGVLIEAGKDPHGVLVLDKLSSELKVEPLGLEVLDTLHDVFGLFFKIKIGIKACFHRTPPDMIHSSKKYICTKLHYSISKQRPLRHCFRGYDHKKHN